MGASAKENTVAPPALNQDPADQGLYSEIGYFRDAYRGRNMARYCSELPEGKAPVLNWAPPGLLVIEDFLHRDVCTRWHRFFADQSTSPATVQEVGKKTPDGKPVFRLDEQRVTQFVAYEGMAAELYRVLLSTYRDVILPHYGEELEWMSQPNVLKYVPGGRYNGHADSEYWNMDQGRWVRSMDRDFSLLLYVNDDYEGGTLYFQNFDIRLTPRAGMLVAFPSDHRFLHAAEPLMSGERFVVVGWGAATGVRKLNPMPPGAIRPGDA